jgi:hypothetical protein
MTDREGDDPRLLARLVCLDNGALACPLPFPFTFTNTSSPASDSTLPNVGLNPLRVWDGFGGNRISLLFPSPFLVFPPAERGVVLSIGDFDDSPFPRFRSARCLASVAAAAMAAASSAAARSSLAGIAFHFGFSTNQPYPLLQVT